MLTVTENKHQGAIILKLEGEVMRETVELLKEEVMEFVNRRGPRLILEMWDVDFMDTRGIAVLLEISRTARRLGGSFVILRPNPNVKRVLEYARMDGLLKTTVCCQA